MRKLAAIAFLGSLAGLCACDEKGSTKDKRADVELSAPEPAKFAKPGPPKDDYNGGTAPASVRQAETMAVAPPAPPASHESAAWRQAMAFDGAGQEPAASEAPSIAPPTVKRVAGVKRNSPVPDSTANGLVVLTDRQMAIDTDGDIRDPRRRASVIAHDRWHQNGTALNVAGRSLDPTVVPFVSVPGGFPYARKGDLVQVSYNGRSVWAVVGDVGPRGRFGEGSIALAEKLGINPDGNTGGAWSGVSYAFPGLRAPTQSQDNLVAFLQARDAGRIMLASN